MGIIEGTRALKTVVAEYDFAVDGGAVSTITLRGDNTIPSGAVITGGFIDIETSCASATGTMAIQAEAAGDILATSLEAALTAGRKSVIPAGTGATSVKTTAARNLKVVIATAAFTAGKFTITLFYK
jgi:hypothetical protein